MARYAYERLSALDAGFLWSEGPNQPMHIGGLAIFDAGSLRRRDGSIDARRYRDAVEGVLHWIPRYRQKIVWTPIEGWPIWVDDRHFDIGYHFRHIALPKPGTREQLKEIAARIHARALDRRHPLWEVWVIEGVEGGEQFALLNKIHHCMIDGAAGADLSQILLSTSATDQPSKPLPYMPRPAPTSAELLRDSIGLGLSRPLKILREAALSSRPSPSRSIEERSSPLETPAVGLEKRFRAMKDLMSQVLHTTTETPINGELGPHRRLEWLTMPLADVRDLRKVLNCTVNDVVLATVAGAMRRYFFRRRVDHRDMKFRVAAPVNTRRPEHDARQGNHVATWIIPLPLDIDDPLEQVRAVQKETELRKTSESALVVDAITQLAEWVPAPLLARGLGRMQSTGPVNMVVTNVPGPQIPLYMLGARLLALYPLVPLMPGAGLGVALFSYDGKLCWGFSADYELVPDLQDFVADVREAFETLRHATVAHFIDRRTAEPEASDVHAAEVAQSVSAESGSEGEVEERDEPGSEAIPDEGSPPPEIDIAPLPLDIETNGDLRSPGP